MVGQAVRQAGLGATDLSVCTKIKIESCKPGFKACLLFPTFVIVKAALHPLDYGYCFRMDEM